jgi:uncharacterized small protein (DUF1192 family)
MESFDEIVLARDTSFEIIELDLEVMSVSTFNEIMIDP